MRPIGLASSFHDCFCLVPRRNYWSRLDRRGSRLMSDTPKRAIRSRRSHKTFEYGNRLCAGSFERWTEEGSKVDRWTACEVREQGCYTRMKKSSWVSSIVEREFKGS